MTILLTDQEFHSFRDLVQARTGLDFRARQREALDKAILAGLTQSQATDLNAYSQQLQAAPTDSPLWDDLVASLTVGETYFFRNPSHTSALRETILPSNSRQKTEKEVGRRFREDYNRKG